MYPLAAARNHLAERTFESVLFSAANSLNFFFIFITTMNSLAGTSLGKAAPVFTVTLDAAKSATPLDGRLLLLLSTDPAEEPRLQISDSPKSQLVFGMDVENWKPGETRTMDATNDGVFGFPIRSLAELQAGEYTVQVLLDCYETFHRAD